MSPAELADALAGAAFRQEREMELAAWVTAHLINVSGKSVKRNVKPSELLGWDRSAPRDPAADFETLVAKHKRQMAEKEQADGKKE